MGCVVYNMVGRLVLKRGHCSWEHTNESNVTSRVSRSFLVFTTLLDTDQLCSNRKETAPIALHLQPLDISISMLTKEHHTIHLQAHHTLHDWTFMSNHHHWKSPLKSLSSLHLIVSKVNWATCSTCTMLIHISIRSSAQDTRVSSTSQQTWTWLQTPSGSSSWKVSSNEIQPYTIHQTPRRTKEGSCQSFCLTACLLSQVKRYEDHERECINSWIVSVRILVHGSYDKNVLSSSKSIVIPSCYQGLTIVT